MNFFSHAVMAAQVDPAPPFVLGSMLPDLVKMAGTRLHLVECHRTQAGIDHHHDVDRVFHQTASFVAWNRQAVQELRAAGLAKGAAMGAAHVGVELLIDIALADQDQGEFCAALDLGQSRQGIVLASPTHRWNPMLERIAASGPPRSLDPVAERIVAALQPHPRLRPQEEDQGHLEIWVRNNCEKIAAGTRQLLAEMLTDSEQE